jgi:hypothetical protein
MIKPKKIIIYDKTLQEELYNLAKKIVLKRIKDASGIIKANIFGSVIKRQLGIYDRLYDNKRWGSDIDVTCLVNSKFKAPKKWKLVRKMKAFDIYDVDALENYLEMLGKRKKPLHPIKFLIFNPEIHDLKEAKEWSAIDEKYSKKQGWSVETWFKIK